VATQEVRIGSGAPVTIVAFERGSLRCAEVIDGDGVGIDIGDLLTDVIDDADHERLVSDLGGGGPIDLSLRHRDGRWMRLRARIGDDDLVRAVLLDDSVRATRDDAARIEAATLRAFSRATTLADAVQPLMETLGEPLDARFIELWLIDHRTDVLRRVATVSRGLPPFHLERVTGPMERALEEGFARIVAEHDEVVWIEHLRDEPRFYRRKEAVLDGIGSVVGVRLGNGSREVGALLLLLNRPMPPDADISELLERLGQQLTMLTLNLRRDELLQRSQRRLRFITELSSVLDKSQDPEVLAKRLTAALVQRVADVAILERVERRRTKRSVASAEGTAMLAIADDLVLLPRRAKGRIKLTEGSHLHQLGARHALVATLEARDQTLGRLILLSVDDPFDDEEELIAKEAARRAAAALDHAQLFSHRSHIARTLQASLLPHTLPAIDGMQIAARYEAAGDGIDSGGDFYDVFATSGASFAAMIGDVQGKGPGAAAITALARYTLRAAALRARRPSRILTLLNEALFSNEQTDRCCTVALARVVMRGADARAVLCLAGHLQPILRSPDGRTSFVGKTGRFLGAFRDTKLFDTEVLLEPGSALILYTDGVTEARARDGSEFHDRRLAELVEGMPLDASAEDIADAIETAAINWQERDLVDDLAILVLCRTNQA
jgi:serine phosphatase RsbU (regulator of sigma subunit)